MELHLIMLEVLKNRWYGKLDDLLEEFTYNGYEEEFEVVEVSRWAIEVACEEDGRDVHYIMELGGTERTIIINKVDRLVI